MVVVSVFYFKPYYPHHNGREKDVVVRNIDVHIDSERFAKDMFEAIKQREQAEHNEDACTKTCENVIVQKDSASVFSLLIANKLFGDSELTVEEKGLLASAAESYFNAIATKAGEYSLDTFIKFLKNSPASNNIIMKIYFDKNVAEIPRSGIEKVIRACGTLKSITGPIKITGYADATGSTDYNKKLSQDRAIEVRNRIKDSCKEYTGKFEFRYSGNELPVTTKSGYSEPENRLVIVER